MDNKCIKVLSMVVLLSLGISGCADNPEESIVVNKDMDKLIEKAEDKGQEGLNIQEDSKKYNEYVTKLENEKLGVVVNVDAKVDIPEIDKLSMYKIEQMKISPELLGRIKEELVKDTVLYDGTIIKGHEKGTIEKQINSIKDTINLYEEEIRNGNTDEVMKADLEVMKEELNNLQELYESAPDGYIFSKGDILDNQFISIKSKYEENTEDEFWKWEHELNPDGELYYGVSNGENNNYTLMYSHNSSNYGNVIRFRTGNHGYERVTSMIVGTNNRRWEGTEVTSEDLKQFISYGDEVREVIPDMMEDTVTLSKEEAIAMADDFLKKVQIDDFKCYDGDVFTEYVDIEVGCDLENIPCRSYYILKYMRTVNGVFVTFSDVSKSVEDNDNYLKSIWPVETMEFRINDKGIVGFDYNAPLEIKEVVVEDTYMKTFEEIQKVFEDMVMVKNASESENDVMEVNVNRVVLGYARICEEDEADKGFLIPVWDFEGSKKAVYEGHSMFAGNNILTINAIDGSIVDRRLGY